MHRPVHSCGEVELIADKNYSASCTELRVCHVPIPVLNVLCYESSCNGNWVVDATSSIFLQHNCWIYCPFKVFWSIVFRKSWKWHSLGCFEASFRSSDFNEKFNRHIENVDNLMKSNQMIGFMKTLSRGDINAVIPIDRTAPLAVTRITWPCGSGFITQLENIE